MGELRAGYVLELRLLGTREGLGVVHALRVVLRGVEGVPNEFRDALYTPVVAVRPRAAIEAYTEAEFRQIRRAARRIVRAAVTRIRVARAEADRYLSGDPRPGEACFREGTRAARLAYVAVHGGVPRRASGKVRYVSCSDLVSELHPLRNEAEAMAILIMCLTGLNASTVLGMSAEHSAATAPGELPALVTRGSKPRRGPLRSEMDLTLSAERRPMVDRDDYGSAHGVYEIALELGREARRYLDYPDLIVYHSFSYRLGTPRNLGYRTPAVGLFGPLEGFSDGEGMPQRVDSRRLRRTFLELHQRPVAQASATLASVYLVRDRTSLSTYQNVVAGALKGEVERIRAENLGLTLSEEDCHAARENPTRVADRFGVTEEILGKVLAGKLDTVGSACVDNEHSPYSEQGRPCTASFLLCLTCPCSRSEPRHVPVQALMLTELRRRNTEMTPAEWDRRFAAAAARLEDVLHLQRADVPAEAERASAEDARLVRALLENELEIP
ncbi:hypothetical protein [Arthrobacter sp. ISL-30]|uniref:hypothetical protein n=1 Tax=Arthrobacter sp. ISL-30 TaxID=2819109 RepID=UPI001BEAF931|nr:hypothetical protein [Arthrobacter sp. ISL-30]MBT2513152.1 hypothetical protein [Arthrobacter sp. ISL-30]